MYNNLGKSGKFKSVVPKRKVANPPHRFDRHQVKIRLNLNFLAYSKSPCQWTGARMRVVKCVLGKSSCVSKIPPVLPTKQRITVSVFLSTLQLTALLLKSFYLRLHCYTLVYVQNIKVGLGISRTNADSQWNPVHNVFHRFFFCMNRPIWSISTDFSEGMSQDIYIW